MLSMALQLTKKPHNMATLLNGTVYIDLLSMCIFYISRYFLKRFYILLFLMCLRVPVLTLVL